MEIRRNTPSGNRQQTPKVDRVRPKPDGSGAPSASPEGIERTIESRELEAAARAKAAEPQEPAAQTEPSAQPAQAKQDSVALNLPGSDLTLRVADGLSTVRENAIAERIREGRKDQVELSDAAHRMTLDLEQREVKVQELRRDYLAGRLVTGARLEQAASGILNDPA